MGLRGPGAARQRLAKEQAAETKRRLPWKRKGLSRAERVIKFLQWLPITKGRRRGKKMKLLPSQREFIENVFATNKAGKRKVSLAIYSAPKGNGKTGLIAGICLAALLGPESEERGAVFSASIDRGKAGLVYDEMRAVILRTPEFASRCNIQDFHKKITVLEGDGVDSVFEALSADARRSQGLSPTLWCYDELGEAPDGALLSVLMESEGKRDETLGIVLSTQNESDDHPLSRLIDDALTGADHSVHLQLHSAPEDADPFSDETLKACNPAWGAFLDIAALQKSRDRARRMPAFESSYRRLRLNQRADANPESRIVTLPVWKQNGGPVDRAALKGRPCFGGLDLSGKNDLTALVLCFPSDDPDPTFDVLPFFWTPEGQLEARRPAEQERFRRWIGEGHMLATPGPTVRYNFVAAEMAKLAREFDVKKIGFDSYRIDDLKTELDDLACELPLEPFRQGFLSLGPAVERFAELALSNKLRHAGHPVLTAAVAGAITVSDAAGNLKIDKERSNGRGPVRVDGAVALAMALQVANRFEPPPVKPSLKGFLKSPIMVI
ncbi:MAG: terminase large subunit [Mesorhizobium sp.]|uniref:terminase large subunit n=1 Tax=Mesorhizobium sp. TaxID=1871066 RepID=UPI00122834D0|nr:terminase TerL endonuclease subunit [Mesorhizobium sp.]TIO52992.1 MAG: terminase large subunit [Mesorhizobium sp.]TIO61825.1 MAG: terminase large subunit [Mesorhizobium sp.]TJV66720.1 MAG: terminase large subunit [Mesorhizobium sp.]